MTEMRQFLLLMWKHYHLRKHRWFMTLIEIFLPIGIAYLLCAKGGKLLGSGSETHGVTIGPVWTTKDFMTRTSFLKVMYTPANEFTREIISKAKEYAEFDRIEVAQNEKELEKFVFTNTNFSRSIIWIGIVFLNAENVGTKPSKLNYKIRDTNWWQTDKLFADIDRPGPIRGDPYFINGFAGVQVAIDMAFIKLWNSDFDYNKYMFQAFPYPEYRTIEELRGLVSVLISYVVILTSLILSVPLISNIIEEKESGIKELMKMAGLKEWVLQVSWFINAIILNLIAFSVVAFFLQYDFNGPQTAVLLNVPATIVWACIILYCIANIAYCFLFTSIFHNLTIASSVFIMFFSILVYFSWKVYSMNSWLLIRLSCLLPIGALYQGFQRIAYFENQQQKVSWSTLGKVEVETEGVSLLFAFLMLIFDTFFYLLLSQYISAINPGTFGSRKSPLFFIERFLYTPPNNGEVNHFQHSTEVQDTKYFEKPPTSLEVSISIERLYKNFGSIPAVKDVNLNVFKGEMTALLGHNGAGKTTTMGILTGMMKPTAGFITYQNRLDILKCMQEFRRRLGLCPQENRLFPYLSAINHLIFFGMLKGASRSDATEEANEYLTMMEMTSKANSLSSSLSGGMKRKLCLSVALMGKVETLILDEPTSGMDVESRRKVWDLLLEMRGNRTIILTTHHMEEADALGDRIAIMNHGTIVCHGTTLFLKKAYGTGYEVTITRDTDNTVPLTNLIRSVVPNADKKYESTFDVVYKLPLTDTAKFPELFYILEEEKDSLAIVNIGVSCTTMEQVFLKVGNVSVSDDSNNSPSRRPTSTEINAYQYPLTKKTGLNLFLQQLAALFLKKFLFIKRNIIKLVSRVLMPTIIMMLLLFDASTIRQEEPPISVALSTYSRGKIMMTDTKTDQFHMFKRTVNYIENHKASILYSNTPNIVQGLLDYAAKSLDSFRKEMVFAASYNATHNLLLYNKFAYHSLAVVINSLSNIELEAVSKENSVRTVNHPIQATRRSCDLSEISSQLSLIFTALAFYSVDLSSYFSIFLSVERIDGFKHIQFMSNLSPFTYWLSNYIFDFVFFFVIVFLRILCFKLIDDRDGFLHFQHPFEVLLLLFCCFIASGLLFTYVVNFFSNSKQGSYAIFLIVNIVGTILVCFFYYIEVMVILYDGNIDSFQFPTPLYYFLKYLILLVPPLNYDLAFLKLIIAWSYNLNAKKPICQDKIKPQKYLVFSSKENFNGLLEEVIFLSIDIILYGVLLWVIEAGYFGLLWNKLSSKIVEKKFGQRNAGAVDPDVNHEQVIVRSQTHQLATRNRDTILLAQSLRKIYMKRRSPFVAVDDVNFAVKAGQCFGLLGVNGAGKSTCFKMLTGYILPTSGDSSIQNIWLSKSKSKYLSKAGYCAQTNCFIEELTGRETLTLVASLRGLSSNQLKSTVDKWLNILGLRSYQNQKCGGYSGGNKRKLCTAMSLIGDPNVVFLDEPTAGVDPVSRRKLYDVMEHSKSSGQAVVLTSHSMEECENLCDRLTIMTGGQMKCIGTAQHLKQRYARGFSILIKTNEIPDEDAALSNLKENMRLAFGEEFCNLKDEHKGLLYYQIKNIRLKWSQLFQTMETVKRDCEIVDDYTITDTSLEEVFMEFAQQAEIENHNRE